MYAAHRVHWTCEEQGAGMSQIAWSPFPGHSSRASPSHTEGLDLTERDE